jgi:hypothetical protein
MAHDATPISRLGGAISWSLRCAFVSRKRMHGFGQAAVPDVGCWVLTVSDRPFRPHGIRAQAGYERSCCQRPACFHFVRKKARFSYKTCLAVFTGF